MDSESLREIPVNIYNVLTTWARSSLYNTRVGGGGGGKR